MSDVNVTMRSVATVILGSFLAALGCQGDASTTHDNPCCETQTQVSADCKCCEVASLETPAMLPAKAEPLVLPALPASKLQAGTLEPSLARIALWDTGERAADRSPPRLYLLNASLLI